MGNQQTPPMPMAGNMQGYPGAYPMPPHNADTMNTGNQWQAQMPMGAYMQGELEAQGAPYPTAQYPQPQSGVYPYMNGQGAYQTGQSSQTANGYFNDPANQSSQTTASAYQTEEPPPSYQI